MNSNLTKNMKLTHLLKSVLLAIALPLAAFAQPTTSSASSGNDFTAFTPAEGSREFMIGGSGSSNKDFDNSSGGLSFAYGMYTSPTSEWLIRQTVSYANPANSRANFDGSTKLAYDWNFATQSRFRPFVGANAGGVYGDDVRDTWAAGLEGGVKYYVMPRTFIAATAEYGWLFNHARDVDDRFDDGQWNWSLAVGFNF